MRAACLGRFFVSVCLSPILDTYVASCPPWNSQALLTFIHGCIHSASQQQVLLSSHCQTLPSLSCVNPKIRSTRFGECGWGRIRIFHGQDCGQDTIEKNQKKLLPFIYPFLKCLHYRVSGESQTRVRGPHCSSQFPFSMTGHIWSTCYLEHWKKQNLKMHFSLVTSTLESLKSKRLLFFMIDVGHEPLDNPTFFSSQLNSSFNFIFPHTFSPIASPNVGSWSF